MFRTFINSQRKLSAHFDALLPARFSVDGNQDFIHRFSKFYYEQINLNVIDVGGGKNPLIPFSIKTKFHQRITGFDIDETELLEAPAAYYDEIICADLTRFVGNGDYDLIICQATLEHIRDNAASFQAFSSMLERGGKLILFCPSRRAIYTIINRLLPQKLKEKLLYTIFPSTERDQGFPAFYNQATIAEFTALAAKNGLDLLEKQAYFHSNYFTFFFPLYFLWRIYTIIMVVIFGGAFAETFSLAFVKLKSYN